MLSFAGGVGTYNAKCAELTAMGYPGFVMS
jgi:hypothetical protein